LSPFDLITKLPRITVYSITCAAKLGQTVVSKKEWNDRRKYNLVENSLCTSDVITSQWRNLFFVITRFLSQPMITHLAFLRCQLDKISYLFDGEIFKRVTIFCVCTLILEVSKCFILSRFFELNIFCIKNGIGTKCNGVPIWMGKLNGHQTTTILSFFDKKNLREYRMYNIISTISLLFQVNLYRLSRYTSNKPSHFMFCISNFFYRKT
jgi:hypothetical protein